MKFFKYEFTPEKWEELKPSIQSSITILDETTTAFDMSIVESVVEIGYIPNEEGVLSDKYSVDILWTADELPAFAPYKIWCNPVGIHSFGESIDNLYITEFNNQ